MSKRFVMRKKPDKPEKTYLPLIIEMCNDDSLQYIVDWCARNSISDYTQVRFKSYKEYGTRVYSFHYLRCNEEAYEKDLGKYKKDLAAYNVWAEENKDKITEYKNRSKKKEIYKIDEEIKRLQKKKDSMK